MDGGGRRLKAEMLLAEIQGEKAEAPNLSREMKIRRGITKEAERMDVATEWMRINEMEQSRRTVSFLPDHAVHRTPFPKPGQPAVKGDIP